MSLNRFRVAIVILLISVFTYSGLIYISASTADFQISVSLTEKVDYQKISSEKSFPLKFTLEVTGTGPISSSAENLYADVFLEDIYIGTLETTRNIIEIPASDSETVYLRFIQDTATISDSDFRYILNSIEEHNGEIKVDVIGEVKPNILLFSIKKDLSGSFYFLDEDKPVIDKLSWNKNITGLGEEVSFEVDVRNVYRGSRIEGILSVDVLFNTSFGDSALEEPSVFVVSLGPGEVKSFSNEFNPANESRYVLSCEWDDELIVVEDEDSIKRLFVYEGTISLLDVYWEVDGVRVSTARINDYVKAHVVLRANSAGVSDYIIMKVRKDIAYASDVDLVMQSFSFLVFEGETEDCVISFYPDEVSGFSFRGYFLEVFFSDDTSWLMDKLYPPRLIVVE